jgi:pimeloyl-ACP methyl ester carboxylesterase
MRNVRVGFAFPLLTALVITLAATSVRADDSPLGMSCTTVTSLDQVTYSQCTGKIPSFDGVGLDVDLSLPTGAAANLPTVLMLHGWGSSKTDWEAATKEYDGRSGYHWNNVWFVSKGYAVVMPTARGFMGSCGLTDGDPACVNGWTHAADRDFENRDSEVILSALIDAGVSDPARLAATGGSYGGGRSWLLATSLPWKRQRGPSYNSPRRSPSSAGPTSSTRFCRTAALRTGSTSLHRTSDPSEF